MNRLAIMMCVAVAAHAAGPNGWLFLQGGGTLPSDQARLFLSYAGKDNVTLALIPTGMYDTLTPELIERERRDTAEHFGAAKVIVMAARNRKEANSREFAEQLRGAQAVWIAGGSIERLAAIYTGTGPRFPLGRTGEFLDQSAADRLLERSFEALI
jgi:cyanophycinase-like exopeptidase